MDGFDNRGLRSSGRCWNSSRIVFLYCKNLSVSFFHKSERRREFSSLGSIIKEISETRHSNIVAIAPLYARSLPEIIAYKFALFFSFFGHRMRKVSPPAQFGSFLKRYSLVVGLPIQNIVRKKGETSPRIFVFGSSFDTLLRLSQFFYTQKEFSQLFLWYISQWYTNEWRWRNCKKVFLWCPKVFETQRSIYSDSMSKYGRNSFRQWAATGYNTLKTPQKSVCLEVPSIGSCG